MGEEDGEWVLAFKRRKEGWEREEEKWIRIGTEKSAWREWGTRKEGNEREVDVVVLEEAEEWIILRQ